MQPEKSIVNVTNVKQMAQVLQEAKSLPFESIMKILTQLFEKGRHVDIRSTIVDTMLTSLARCTGEQSKHGAGMVLSVLESTVPIISSINEAEPWSEIDWIEAEKSRKTPLPMDQNHPILNSPLNANVPSDFVKRIILPPLHLSKSNNNRWLRLVLEKYDAPSHLASLSTPFSPSILAKLLSKYQALLPLFVLEEYTSWVMQNIAPIQPLSAVMSRFKNEAAIQSLPEAQRLLSLFSQGEGAATSPLFKIANRVCSKWLETKHPDGIRVVDMQRLLLEQVAVLSAPPYAPNYEQLYKLVEQFRPKLNSASSDKDAWSNNACPIIQQIIDRVDSQRTPEWQGSPNREPASLSWTFPWKIWLLLFPELEEVTGEWCCRFARAMRDVIIKIASFPSYHEELRELVVAAYMTGQRACLLSAVYL